MKIIIFTTLILFYFFLNSGCTDNLIVYPDYGSQGTLINTIPITDAISKKIEGIYSISDGGDHFGTKAVVLATGTYITVLCEANSSYFILKAGSKDSSINLEGYWRFAEISGNGGGTFTIDKNKGGIDLLYSDKAGNIVITGNYLTVSGQSKKVTLKYEKPLTNRNSGFKIIAHRGGGRNSDNLPHSENSAELMMIAERYGANAIEIDVQLTKDNIPIIFHDNNFSTRLIKGEFLIGPVGNFSLKQIKTFGKLIRDEEIPTLEEALDSVINKTNLSLVWIDVKIASAVAPSVKIIEKYQTLANSIWKSIDICIGIPSTDVLNEFIKQDNYKNIKSICEISVADVKNINAIAFGPSWSRGLMNSELNDLHSAEKKGFVWTLDEKVFIDKFLKTSKFDGIVTNYPTVVAYMYYTNNE